jgi:hypothetical protein
VLAIEAHRTRQSLTRIAPGLREDADVKIKSELYAASAADLLAVPDELKSVMLIGHNPGIQDLAVSLARGGSEIGHDISSTEGREKLRLGLRAMRVLGIAPPRGPATEPGPRGGLGAQPNEDLRRSRGWVRKPPPRAVPSARGASSLGP